MATAFEQVRQAGPTNKQGSNANLDGVQLLGVYFSANWCPPCRQFTPMLNAAYNQWKAQGESIEIVFMTNCQNAQATDEYYGHMDFLRVSHGHPVIGNLSGQFGVSGIPFLAIVDHTGKVVSQNAVGEVYGGAGAIQAWKSNATPHQAGGGNHGYTNPGEGPKDGWHPSSWCQANNANFISQGASTAIQIHFKNSTHGPLRVDWVNYEGGLTNYATLQPGKAYNQQTFSSHPWAIFRGNEALGVFSGSEIGLNHKSQVEFFQEGPSVFCRVMPMGPQQVQATKNSGG